jgi:hypothetical protein
MLKRTPEAVAPAVAAVFAHATLDCSPYLLDTLPAALLMARNR